MFGIYVPGDFAESKLLGTWAGLKKLSQVHRPVPSENYAIYPSTTI